MFEGEIAAHRDAILERWIEHVIEGYPEETAEFLRSKSDRFANPVGARFREGLEQLLDGVIEGVEPAELESALDHVVRIRAVQQFSPSDAVGFVFDLKRLVHDILGEPGGGPVAGLAAFDSSVERLGLHAFDVYMRCREHMWAIRAREIRNQSVGIMERVAAWRERREKTSETVPQT